jgi:patatin-like phospholipase/acyl hydrolase
MHQVKKNPSMDALLSDICIATSAAPTYLPSYYFKTKDAEGKVIREFHLIDGGIAANNPVHIYIDVPYNNNDKFVKTSSFYLTTNVCAFPGLTCHGWSVEGYY